MVHKMVHKKVIFFTILFIINFFSIDLSYGYESNIINDNEINILVINSYDEDDEWEKNILDGFRDEINKLISNTVNIFNEYVDIRYRKDDEYIFEIIDFFEKKYKGTHIDFIFAIDDAAFEIVKYKLLDKDSIFYLKNVIFTGVNKTNVIESEKLMYMNGILQDSSAKLIDTILGMHKNIDTINVLIDKFVYSNEVKHDIQAFKSLYKRPIKINFIQKDCIEDIKEELEKKKNDKDEVVIISGIFKESKSNEYMSASDSIKEIKSITGMPIYTTNEFYINEEIVGGYVTKSEQQGIYAAKELYNAIQGNKHNSKFATSEGVFIFNYDMIYKYDIDVSNMPKHMEILNRPFGAPILPKEILLLLYLLLFSSIGIFIYFIRLSIWNKKLANEKQVSERIENERKKMRANFIINMSHELRTPVNLMLITSDVSLKKLRNNSFTKEWLIQEFEQVQKNSNRLLKIVNNVIDMTKIEYNEFNLKFQNLDIVEVVENIIIEILEYLDYSIDIVFDTDVDKMVIAIDEEQIQRVILNLISNCVKFAPNSRIDISIEEKSNNVCILITDHGQGISEDKLKRIFNPFYYVGETLIKIEEGSGVGLYLAKRIIHLHGGTITVTSRDKTTFKIRLPKETVEENEKINKIYDFRTAIKIEMADINTKEV